MGDILQYLILNDEHLDSAITTATGILLAKVRLSVSEPSANGMLARISFRYPASALNSPWLNVTITASEESKITYAAS